MMNQNEQMRELCRRLYVELYHCDKQMTSTLDDEGEQLWKTGKTVSDVLADAKQALAAEPALSTLGFAQGIEAAAKMLDAKADDYAKDFGFDDTGGLAFSRESQREYHSTLIELAEEVRSIKAAEPAPLVRLTQIERDRIATSCQSTQQVISATIEAMIAKNGGKV